MKQTSGNPYYETFHQINELGVQLAYHTTPGGYHPLHWHEEIELLYRTGLSHLLMEHIVRCGKQSRTGEWKNTYQTAFLSGALCGLVNEWVLQGMKDSPEKMEQIFLKQETENDDP